MTSLSGVRRRKVLKWVCLAALGFIGGVAAGGFACPGDPIRPYMVAFAFWIVAKINIELALTLPVELPYFYQGRDLENRGARQIAFFVSWALASYFAYFATTLPEACVS